jgi:hypothetical protein
VLTSTCVTQSPKTIHHRYERPKLRKHNEDVNLTVLDGLPADQGAAGTQVLVISGVSAPGAPLASPGPYPSVDRMAQIWEKLAEPEAAELKVDGAGASPLLASRMRRVHDRLGR